MSNMRIKYKRLDRENIRLRLRVRGAFGVIEEQVKRIHALEAENAALRDKIEQAERAMRPFLK